MTTILLYVYSFRIINVYDDIYILWGAMFARSVAGVATVDRSSTQNEKKVLDPTLLAL